MGIGVEKPIDQDLLVEGFEKLVRNGAFLRTHTFGGGARPADAPNVEYFELAAHLGQTWVP